MTPSQQRHLSACEPCRNAFVEEQSLFTAIDADLRCVANPEIPATLVPRVHVALNNGPSPHIRSHKWTFASAALAVVFVALLAIQLSHRQSPTPMNTMAIQVSSSSPEKGNEAPSSEALLAKPVLHIARKAPTPRAIQFNTESPIAPEVLVPPEEGKLLQAYALSFASSQRSELISATNMDKEIVPVDVEFLEIAKLEIKPLVGGSSN